MARRNSAARAVKVALATTRCSICRLDKTAPNSMPRPRTAVSHRGQAMQQLIARLQALYARRGPYHPHFCGKNGVDRKRPSNSASPRRWRSTSTCRGACRSARIAISTRMKPMAAPFPSASTSRPDRRSAIRAAADLGPAGDQRLLRRRHAQPALAGGHRRTDRRLPRARHALAGSRNHAGSQSRHGRGRQVRRLSRRRRQSCCRSASRVSTTIISSARPHPRRRRSEACRATGR
jgi:hypothetical protein